MDGRVNQGAGSPGVRRMMPGRLLPSLSVRQAEPLPHPVTAPAVSPATMRRWNTSTHVFERRASLGAAEYGELAFLYQRPEVLTRADAATAARR